MVQPCRVVPAVRKFYGSLEPRSSHCHIYRHTRGRSEAVTAACCRGRKTSTHIYSVGYLYRGLR
eukprot:360119-Rhodomonas_salina.1